MRADLARAAKALLNANQLLERKASRPINKSEGRY